MRRRPRRREADTGRTVRRRAARRRGRRTRHPWPDGDHPGPTNTVSPGGFLVFDNPRAAAKESLAKLAQLEIDVKVATGDNPRVAEKVCRDLGLTVKGAITGTEMERLSPAISTTWFPTQRFSRA